VTIDSRGSMSEDMTLSESCHSEVCGIEDFGNPEAHSPNIFVAIDLDRERGPLIPLMSVVNFASSEFKRLALW
jgi:hypothetical protein